MIEACIRDVSFSMTDRQRGGGKIGSRRGRWSCMRAQSRMTLSSFYFRFILGASLRHEFSNTQYFGGGRSGGETVGGRLGDSEGAAKKRWTAMERMGAAERLLRILYINCQA